MTNISEPLFPPLVDPVTLQPLLTNKGGLQARDGDKFEIENNIPKIVSNHTNYAVWVQPRGSVLWKKIPMCQQ